MKEEILKPIEGYKYYEVSSLGQVRSISHHTANPCRFREGRILSQTKVNNGYMHVTLTQELERRDARNVHPDSLLPVVRRGAGEGGAR